MSRFIRNTVILAATEATYGSAASLTGADAILVSSCTIKPISAKNVPRDLVRGYFGGSEHLVGTAFREVSCTVELAGSGTATTPPKIGRLLQAMGFAQTIGAASVDYTPVSTFGANSSLTMKYHLDGVEYTLLGVRGTWDLGMGVGDRPELRCRFVGLLGGEAAVGNPTGDFTAFRAPLVVTDANTGDLLIGAVTYTAGTGVIAAGSASISTGIQLALGGTVNHQPLLGQERVQFSAREVTGKIVLEQTAAEVVAAMAAVRANTLTALGITHGTTAGNIVGLYLPNVQRLDPSIEDMEGTAMDGYGIRALPLTGNDELRIVFR